MAPTNSPLHTTVRTALTPLTAILTQAQSAGTQAQQFRPLLQQLSATAPAVDRAIQSGPGLRPLAEQAQRVAAVLDPLNTSTWCAATPQCAQIRDQVQVLVSLRDSGFFTQVAGLGDRYYPATVTSTLTDVQSAATSLVTPGHWAPSPGPAPPTAAATSPRHRHSGQLTGRRAYTDRYSLTRERHHRHRTLTRVDRVVLGHNSHPSRRRKRRHLKTVQVQAR